MSFGLEVWNKERDKIFDLDHKYVTITGVHEIKYFPNSNVVSTHRYTLPIPPNVDPFVFLDTRRSDGYINISLPTRSNLEFVASVQGWIHLVLYYGFLT